MFYTLASQLLSTKNMAAPIFCCVHVVENEIDKIVAASEKSRNKINDCKEEWIRLGGIERSVAIKLNNLQAFSGGNGSNDETVYGYHRKCYMRFTDRSKIEKAKTRMQKSVKNIYTEPKRAFRTALVSSTSSAGIFPYICVICNKEQYTREKYTRKRKKEKLVQCQTYNASQALHEAAVKKQDERLLCKIHEIDCIAKEVKYHKSCYLGYTKCTKNNTDSINDINKRLYSTPYKMFCSTVIENQIIDNAEVMRMNKLTKLFFNCVEKSECSQSFEINNRQLKRWLLRDYPQLVFVKPTRRNLSELVLCCLDRNESMLIHNQGESISSNSASETDYEELVECSTSERLHEDQQYDIEAKHNLYTSAIFLRKLLSESPSLDCAWPPIAEDLSEEAAFKMIPPLLYNFIAWCVGESDEVEMGSVITTTEQSKKKILCIAQDIVYLASKGRKYTPKHLSLAMATRHITGSAKMIGILNGLGHCVSNSTVLEHDTALAEMQLQQVDEIPTGIFRNCFATLVWDNIDFGEETLSGHNTTHSTNGIIIQRTNKELSQTLRIHNKRTRKRTLDPPITHISEYYSSKKCGPQNNFPITECEFDERITVASAKDIDSIFILCKLPEFRKSESLPGWTGFNTNLQAEYLSPLSTIRYLPVVEANPTEMSTVYTLLLKSVAIADKLEVKELALVFDQAIYAKAQQIRWKIDTLNKRLVVRLGEFHTSMAFLAILGKRFKDAGLSDIMIESGIVAEGSINGVILGKHYNRSIRAHKLVFEGLSRILWTVYLGNISEEQYMEIDAVSKELHELYLNGKLEVTELPPSFTIIMRKFTQFVEENCKNNATFAFWISYLDLVQLLLQFIRATRVGDWMLHLASINEMIPWFFSYDRVNYARYLPVYFLEMINLQTTHPFVYSNVIAGDFVVGRQNVYSFSGTACDQVIEQTANRDSKTKGGLIGITQNQSAVHRWMLSHHVRAQISMECEKLAGKERRERNRKDLDKSRIKKDELNVITVVNTVLSMINPFTLLEDGIVNISSGVLASADVQKDLERAESIGKLAYKQYREVRLLSAEHELDIFSPIKLQKLLMLVSPFPQINNWKQLI